MKLVAGASPMGSLAAEQHRMHREVTLMLPTDIPLAICLSVVVPR
jgi:hypothetical protein